MNTKWLIKNWFRVGHKISWKLNFETLTSLLYFVPVFQNDFIYRIVQKKHKFVLDYLSETYSELIEKYKRLDRVSVKTPENNKHYIWVMWWQGEEAAPELVRMCIDSMRRNANGAEVVVIDKNNYRQYADIPSYIIEKHNKGYISFAQLSDIMRIYLISSHGGLWLDSTIYVSQKIPSEIFEQSFYSLHTSLKKTAFVQNDRVHCFVLGGRSDSKLISFVKELLSSYWADHDVIIDYYLLDYSIMLAYWKFDDIHTMIDNLKPTSEGLYDLVSVLDNPYEEDRVSQILADNLFSKLVWNQKHRYHIAGKDTVYSVLLKETE